MTVNKRKAAKEIETGQTTICEIPAAWKPNLQAKELAQFNADVKAQLNKNRGVVLVMIAADRVQQQ